MKKYKPQILITLIICLAVLLRLYRIQETFVFFGEIGHNLLAIKNAFASRTIPLLGPPTSHPWLYFGPFYYWIYGPILVAFSFNPLSHAYFGAFISVMIVVTNYFVIKRILDIKTALISSLLISVSPLFLEFSRSARFFSIVSLVVYIYLYLLWNIITGKNSKYFLLGLVFGSMFSFHFTPLMLVPFMATVFIVWRKTRELFMNSGRFAAGFTTAMLPFFLADILRGFTMTRNVFLWVPYRIAGFFGFVNKNTASPKVLTENVTSLLEFSIKSLVNNDSAAYIGIVVVTLLVCSISFVINTWRINRKSRMDNGKFFIVLWFLWGYAAVFIHGSPPIHYFVPILAAPILLFSILFAELWKKFAGKVFVTIFILCCLIFNIRYYFSGNWYYLDNSKMTVKPYYVPFALQQEITREIISDARSRPFSLRRIGLDDQFEGDYAQNYIYLLWLYGNEPGSSSRLVYTIFEETDREESAVPGELLYKAGNLRLFRQVK